MIQNNQRFGSVGWSTRKEEAQLNYVYNSLRSRYQRLNRHCHEHPKDMVALIRLKDLRKVLHLIDSSYGLHVVDSPCCASQRLVTRDDSFLVEECRECGRISDRRQVAPVTTEAYQFNQAV